MGEVIKLIVRAVGGALSSYFSSDMDVMSDEAKAIFSNEEDRKKYIDAVDALRDPKGSKEPITITLSNQEKITLVS